MITKTDNSYLNQRELNIRLSIFMNSSNLWLKHKKLYKFKLINYLQRHLPEVICQIVIEPFNN